MVSDKTRTSIQIGGCLGVLDPVPCLILKNKGLKEEMALLDKKEMSEMNMKPFVKALERKYGAGIFIPIQVIPAHAHPSGKKKLVGGDHSDWTRERILAEREAGGGNMAHRDNNFSLYLKHMEGLSVIDFDTKEMKDSLLYDRLVASGTFHTETDKGYHFYVHIDNLPPYQNEVDLANLTYFNAPDDIDLITTKRNVWEPFSRKVRGKHIQGFNWECFSQFFNEPKMNFVGAPPPVAIVQEEEEEAIVPAVAEALLDMEEVHEGIDAYRFKRYLDRLGESRYGYDDWVGVGMIAHSNFEGSEEGFTLWREWSLKDLTGNHMTMVEQLRKYDSFDADTQTRKKTWKTLRYMADQDNPENPYQTIYEGGGEDAITRELNTELSYNKKTSEYILGLPDDDWEQKSRPQVMAHYEKYDFPVTYLDPKGKEVTTSYNPFKVWVKNINRREVNKIVFDPRNQSPDCHNLWTGYPLGELETVASCDESLCSPIIDHIHKHWCRSNQDHTDYVLNWLASKLQKPWKKVAVTIVLKSKEGSGKNIILNHFKKIMGNYYISLSNVKNVLGDFNGAIEGKMLINADEISYGGNKKEMNQLKALITEDETVINKKNKEQFKINNYADYIFTTNELWFIGVTSHSRRFFVLDMDDWLSGVKDGPEKNTYIQTLLDVPSDCLAKYLLTRDISGFNPREFARTDLFQRQVQLNWTSDVKYIHKIMESGYLRMEKPRIKWELGDDDEMDDVVICREHRTTHEQAHWFKMDAIYSCYCSSNLGGYATRVPQHSFFTTFYEIFPTVREMKYKNSKVLRFPTLADARANFNAFQNYTFDYGIDLVELVEDDEYMVHDHGDDGGGGF